MVMGPPESRFTLGVRLAAFDSGSGPPCEAAAP